MMSCRYHLFVTLWTISYCVCVFSFNLPSYLLVLSFFLLLWTLLMSWIKTDWFNDWLIYIYTVVSGSHTPDLWHTDRSGGPDPERSCIGQQLQEELCHLQPHWWPGVKRWGAVGCASVTGHPQVWQIQHEPQWGFPSKWLGGHHKHWNCILSKCNNHWRLAFWKLKGKSKKKLCLLSSLVQL